MFTREALSPVKALLHLHMIVETVWLQQSSPDGAAGMQVRDWYIESFRELKALPPIRDTADELRFTGLLKHIYQRHAHVVPTMARYAQVPRYLSLLFVTFECQQYVLVASVSMQRQLNGCERELSNEGLFGMRASFTRRTLHKHGVRKVICVDRVSEPKQSLFRARNLSAVH